MGSSKKQTVGYKYYLGAHMYLGHSEFDKITRIRVANKPVWAGAAMDEQIYINQPNAFGGEEREGGIVGYVDVLSGSSTQTVNAYLNSVQPVASESIPAYKGKTSLVLNQTYMGINPYMKNWQVLAQRIHKTTAGAAQWYDAKSAIGSFGGTFSYFYTLASTNYPIASPYIFIGYEPVTGREIQIKFPDPSSGFIKPEYDAPTGWDDPNIPPPYDDGSYLAGHFWHTFGAGAEQAPTKTEAVQSLAESLGLENIDFGAPDGPQSGTVSGYLYDASDNFYYNHITPPPFGTLSATVYRCIDATAPGPNLQTAWPEGEPIQLNYNPQNGVFETNQYQQDAGDYSTPSSTVSLEDEFGAPITVYVDIDYINNDMNPAHIIRECLTDTRYGLGYTSADIDDISFTAAADTLYDEVFGLSFYWNNDQEIEEFIRNVLRHIDATLYVDHTTGKFSLKLIRDDYIIENLTVLDQTNVVSISDYKKPTIGELTNYVTVNYWDGNSSEDSSISVQDIALAQMQGSVVSATIDYDGITRGSLATRVASRDLAALSNPLITCTIIANREAATLNNGDAFVLNWPKYGISNVVMRVGEINFGELASGKVRIKAVQDVFALPAAIYSQPEDSGWTPVVSDPIAITNQIAQETPYWLLIQDQGEDFAPDALDGYLMTAAGQPSSDSIRYRIWTDETGGYVEQEYADFCPTATIDHDWPKANNGVLQKTVNVTGIDAEDIDQIDIGSAALINGEWLGVVSITATGTNTATCEFDRSVADTAIADHTSGDRIYFFGSSLYGTDNTLFQDSDAINVKLTPQTGNGQLNVADATAIALTFDQRAYRAYPPANIKLNTVYFPDQITDTGSVDSTWAHRDRLLQTAGLIDFDEASIGPESSTTYTTTLYRVNNETVLDTNTGLTGTSDSLDPGGYDGLVRYEIKSVRDSLDSLYSQSHQFVVSRTKPLQEESFGDFLYTEDLEIIMTES